MRLLEAHIEVEDVAKSLLLYEKLITHKKIVSWADGEANAFILQDGTAFGVWKKGKKGIHRGQGAAHLHFAFQIGPDEYGRYVSLIQDAGLVPLEHIWENGQKSVYFFDYDGNQGEFLTCDWLDLN